jgi:hypothetical protein
MLGSWKKKNRENWHVFGRTRPKSYKFEREGSLRFSFERSLEENAMSWCVLPVHALMNEGERALWWVRELVRVFWL